jgi:hypothetical protein
MRRLIAVSALVFASISASAQTIPNVPDTARYASYNVVTPTTNFSIPFALYGDCTDIVVKVATMVQDPSTYTCISLSGTFANKKRPVTDAQVQFTTAVPSGLVEIVGAWHPRFGMGASPGISRDEFNTTLGKIISRERETYDTIKGAVNGPVLSVAGRTGVVSVGPPDIAGGTFPGSSYTFPGILFGQTVSNTPHNGRDDGVGTQDPSVSNCTVAHFFSGQFTNSCLTVDAIATAAENAAVVRISSSLGAAGGVPAYKSSLGAEAKFYSGSAPGFGSSISVGFFSGYSTAFNMSALEIDFSNNRGSNCLTADEGAGAVPCTALEITGSSANNYRANIGFGGANRALSNLLFNSVSAVEADITSYGSRQIFAHLFGTYINVIDATSATVSSNMLICPATKCVIDWQGNALFGATTASVSPSTGALVVTGGVGVGGQLRAASDLISSASVSAGTGFANNGVAGVSKTCGATIVASGGIITSC